MQSKVAARNEDYATIIRKITFGRAPAAHCAADCADPADGTGSPTAAAAEPPVAMLDDLSVHGGSEVGEGSVHAARRRRGETSSVVYRAAHAVVWMGDFNYRIDLERCAALLLSTLELQRVIASSLHVWCSRCVLLRGACPTLHPLAPRRRAAGVLFVR